MPINTKAYIEAYVKIVDKAGNVIGLRLNKPQQKLYDALTAQYKAGKPMRAIVLKARQMGFSTLTEAMIFKRTVTRFRVNSGIVAHKDDASSNLFNMSRRMYEQLPDALKPQRRASNAKELVFDDRNGKGLGSRIKVMTAGGDGIGRSDTFQNLHISEYAFWPGDKEATLLGLLQAVPSAPDTMVVIESTANGFDPFKKRWDAAVAGQNDFAAVFCGWWEMEEYRRPYDGFALTDEEEQLKKRFDLDNEQLSWRRWCIENYCGGDVDKFRQEYPAYPEEAFLSTGECIFDKETITKRLGELTQPKRMCLEENIRLVQGREVLGLGAVYEHKRGPLLVYEEPKPGVPYVIGADTAGDGSDWFVAQVLDNTTGRQVAMLRQQYDEDAFARQCMCLGYWYNEALLGIEANFSTFPLKECQRLGYTKLYTRQTEDSYTQRYEKRYGFRTTALTRPIILAGLVQIVRQHPESIRDEATLREMLTFVRNEHGRAEAMAGEHDDCVMALAIAHYIRPQQEYTAKRADAAVYDEDEAPDYERQLGNFLNFGV